VQAKIKPYSPFAGKTKHEANEIKNFLSLPLSDKTKRIYGNPVVQDPYVIK
jgi:hypothetical protein